MISPRVVGIDPSLTGTGLAGAGWTVRLTPPKNLDGVRRMKWLRAATLDYLKGTDLVVVEGVSFMSNGAYAAESAGWHWVLRLALDTYGLAWVEVPPASVKKYAVGRGNATKEDVLAAAIRRLPGFTASTTDEADAGWLRAMALDGLGYPQVVMPEAHRVALAKIAWPELAGVA